MLYETGNGKKSFFSAARRAFWMAALAVLAALMVNCSQPLAPAEDLPPIILDTLDNFALNQENGSWHIIFTNPLYMNPIPAGIDTSLLFFVLYRNSHPVFDSTAQVALFPAMSFKNDSVVHLTINLADPTAMLIQGIQAFYLAGCLRYSYHSGPLSPVITYPGLSSLFEAVKELHSNGPLQDYKITTFANTRPPGLASLDQEISDYFQAISYNTCQVVLEIKDTVFSPSVTGNALLQIADNERTTQNANDVSFILGSNLVSRLYGRYATIPGGYANGSYFVLTDNANPKIFAHEMLHNVDMASFKDLYNGYLPIEVPYVNSLAGSLFGDSWTWYFPKLYRAYLGWESFSPAHLTPGHDTVVSVRAVTPQNRDCSLYWLGIDENGYSWFISLELISANTPFRDWQGPGLRVYEFFEQGRIGPDFVHLFPLGENGEEVPVREKVFCQGIPNWRDANNRSPLFYASASQRGLTISVIHEYGDFDSMDVHLSLVK